MLFKGLSAFIFLLLSGLVFGADNDCSLSDASCVSARDDDDGKYWVKIKRLYSIDLGSWGGNELVSGATAAAEDNRRFCVIAYYQEEDDGRTVYNYETRFSGDAHNGQFVLKGSGNKYLPVTITLEGVGGDAQAGFSQAVTSNAIYFNGSQAHPNCKTNEFILKAEVNRSDILLHAQEGIFEGDFTLTARGTNFPAADDDEDPDPRTLVARVDFNIRLEFVPLVMISGLEDMPLSYTTGSNIEAQQNFCVYTFATSDFKIKGASQYGTGQFELASNNERILYQLDVGKAGNNGQGNALTLIEGGDFVSHSSWRGSTTPYCLQHTAENMRLQITIQETDITGKPSGVYKDTAYLTVVPD